MSEKSGAVFLSYASQDADAARRLADALRVTGVEVWFDQSELLGGDAWDHKIRHQIRECALLIPVISKTTQSRREAYFRLEWNLAEERTHLMAKGTPFLLPVTIDDTNDRDALVPDSFLTVQWTKAPGGELPPAFCARVKRLLDGEPVGAALRRDGIAESRRETPPTVKSGLPRWVRPLLASAVVVVIVLAVTFVRSLKHEAPASPSVPSSMPAGKISPARELANKALVAMTSSATGPELGAAIKQAEHATTMDEFDGEIWAISALVDLSAYEMYWDRSEQRRDAIRAKLVKATGLAVRSPLTRYAEAKSLIRLDTTPDALAAALEILQALRTERPREPDELKILGLIGLVQQGQGKYEEAGRTLEQAGLDWANAASWAYLMGGDLSRALAMAKRQASIDPVQGRLQEARVQFSRGDLAAVQVVLDELPVSARVGEYWISIAVGAAYLHRDADALLERARRYPQTFFDGQNGLLVPRGYYVGLAYAWLGRAEAARAEWIETLRQVEERQATDSASDALKVAHMFLLVRLGRIEEATRELKLFRQQIHDSSGPAVVGLLTALDRNDEALDEMERLLTTDLKDRWSFHSSFRLDPQYDPLRGNVRFQKLLRDTRLPDALPLEESQTESKR